MILPTPKILMVDNYDSFTWNLVHYLGEAGAEVEVVRNDQMTADEAMARRPDGILLSPGPCDPDRAGICLDMVAAAARTGTPLLGVCLGHQTIGQAFGGHVVRGPKPMHGKVTAIHHHGGPLFDGLPETFPVTRYHSLVVERASLPAALVVTAEDDDGIIMGLSHRELPIHGVQFHPESIASAHGHELIGNFLKTVRTSGTARATETA
ncbi:MAG: aminodeoxychorismate/anthranilate synthase component II [Tistrella sp.]|uniref:Aminodeoxychorismate/anthranilate synthase component II n=1 Tax=Tistrella mobilis TaxID=171437 RepID=A0A3B9IKB5_9PROT|nr:aminodeoxychorismate/anthranilate synthase component II [Tistrella sp.]MAD35759.1 aminodeoxychorismate/anthranilate synthase component II [Tistrella sp.]MBA79448.1 aminodeoxychorismate/anthranilate synthase component II [Tistrella sp.]HAE48138.1 aminodeoxychorismate/anthranilate synthase component II [Tistrella mobilis]